jgi:hypothetical protein
MVMIMELGNSTTSGDGVIEFNLHLHSDLNRQQHPAPHAQRPSDPEAQSLSLASQTSSHHTINSPTGIDLFITEFKVGKRNQQYLKLQPDLENYHPEIEHMIK